MALTLRTPTPRSLTEAMDVLAGWQGDQTPLQLHPGDIGWHLRFGLAQTADALRTFSRDGKILAIGLLDGPDLLRLAIAPPAHQDMSLAHNLAQQLQARGSGAPLAQVTSIELPTGAVLREMLERCGWRPGEQWAPLRWDLGPAVPDPGMHIEVVGPELAQTRAELQRASFEGSTFTAQRWHTMAAGPTYRHARCLLAIDDHGEAVATTTVWSAGADRAGLIEPLGVAAGQRGRGYGTAITRAAAATLRELGASSALVCTQSANTAAVAAYCSAGFTVQPIRRDLGRER